MKYIPFAILALVAFAIVVALTGAAYTITETDQVVLTQFGEPVGDPIVDPGLHWKLPFIQRANSFDKRFLEWDGNSNQLPTRDKRFIHVDTYARWRITDPLRFFQVLRDELGAQSRLDDVLDGETRNTIARHDLIEVVRTTNRALVVSEELGAETGGDSGPEKIDFGRAELAQEVLDAASPRVKDWGIEILDFRFKRINYVEQVRQEVYARMISERQRIAEQFRSEGAGASARINGERERALATITSEAYREAEEIKGHADAEAADIYAKAYNRDPEFYRFKKTMEVFLSTMNERTTLVLGTDGEYMRYLENSK